MARQVLPIAGAIVGGMIGGPMGAQIGYALGSVIGNAVDPLEIQGNKVGDNPLQTAAEGGARAILFGTGCIRATCLIERGNRRVKKQRDQAGKGGGPVTINERVYWTFAVGLGEARPGATILRIWEGEKLVYDVRPGSAIPEESAKFAERFRFYDGSETQLPDPDLEVIHGVGEAPYYRGTMYVVFPNFDLTDYRESIPVYRWEVAESADVQTPIEFLAIPNEDSSTPGAYLAETADLWNTTGPAGTKGRYVRVVDGRALVFQDASLVYSDDYMATTGTITVPWSAITDAPVITSSGRIYVAEGSAQALHYSDDKGDTWVTVNLGFTCTFIAGDDDELVVASSSQLRISFAGPTAFAAAISGPTVSITALDYGDGMFMLQGPIFTPDAYWSTDSCTSFTPVAVPAPGGDELETSQFFRTSAGSWLAFNRTNVSTTTELIAYSPDGVQPFIYVTTPSAYQNGGIPDGFAEHDGTVVAFAEVTGGVQIFAILKSTDGGASWTRVDHTYSGFTITKPVSGAAFDSQSEAEGQPIQLADIISALHIRAGHTSGQIDVSALTDEVAGVVFEQSTTVAEAINSVIGSYISDPSDYDQKIRYIKRGGAVVRTLTYDDLVEEPDSSRRENAIEYPRKLHYFFQSPITAYAATKATSARSSPDVRVLGEVSVSSPVTFDNEDEPAQIAAMLHKIYWTDAEGEIVWHVSDAHADLVPTDCVGLSLRGITRRARIVSIEDSPGIRKLTMRVDRQSAYTSEVTGIPLPPPTPPPPSILAQSLGLTLDIPALTDNADELHYLRAITGLTDVWPGAADQRSFDGGSSFSTFNSTGLNAIVGVLQNNVTAASPHYTDTTNTLTVRLYMDDEMESITDQAFLSEGGAFALSYMDGTTRKWELMQRRDVEEDSDGNWVLSHLLRGRLNTEAAAHGPGDYFVWLDGAVMRNPAQTAWLGQEITHRAVTNGLSPETAPQGTITYTGKSQTEFPVAHVLLERDGDDITVTIVPRHRFGTDDAPVQSGNWNGYSVEISDGLSVSAFSTTSDTFTFDASGLSSPIQVAVAQRNRLTGIGPYVSESIA